MHINWLIFYWKILRIEGMKVFKAWKYVDDSDPSQTSKYSSDRPIMYE
jgi:hypothetical protein